MSQPVMFDVVIDSEIVEVAATAPSFDISTADQPLTVVTLEGPPGPRGLPGDNTAVYNEIPAGTQDGANETFSLANNFQDGTTNVFRNGLLEQLGVGYTESSPDIMFTTPPLPSDVITVNYLIA